MTSRIPLLSPRHLKRGLVLGALLAAPLIEGNAGTFTPLTPISPPTLASAAEPYPGDSYAPSHATDASPKTEYASNGKGTNTFLRFTFSAPVKIGAFRHLDRNDPATVAESELTFADAGGVVNARVPVVNVNQPAGETFQVFQSPVTAQTVTWRVSRLGDSRYTTVGAAEIQFFAAGVPDLSPSRDSLALRPLPFLEKGGGQGLQRVKIEITHPYAEGLAATLKAAQADPIPVQLKPGLNRFEVTLPAAASATVEKVSLQAGGEVVAQAELKRSPIRPLTVYLLPHSHTDIGYTEIQTAIEKKQVQNLVDGIRYARATADYPEGARFVWNVEVLWAADLYLKRLNEEQRADFFQAVRKGQVVLNGMYLNELTGLCRPEELVQLFQYATELGQQTGARIDSVMISDVPGYTWGTVTAMAHAGIKYFSTAPNYFDRIGTILREWENKPFWWAGPDGRSRVLVWIPFWGYAMSHRYGRMSEQLVQDFYEGLEKRGYPYEIAYARWSGHGDNAVPDPSICDFVRDWNTRYVWPRFVISGTSEAFAAMEKRYGDQLPTVRGDWTPYWEDGAGSSARETALNRATSDRLVQAETLYAMLQPSAFPAAEFGEAWRNVLLYSEHTWGADCSISQPESQKTREQWDLKQGYALRADEQTRHLLNRALDLSGPPADAPARPGAIQVINTTSWSRSEIVYVSPELSAAGDRVEAAEGRAVPSQRLSDHRLAFLAENVPPFSVQEFRVGRGAAAAASSLVVTSNGLENELIRVRLDPKTGSVSELERKGCEGNFILSRSGQGANEYLYFVGDDVTKVQRAGPVKITVGERGPLVASLIVESPAPGCNALHREVRLCAGMDYVELNNRVDKQRLQAKSYHASDGKESLNFGFPFDVPKGELWLDLPLGAMRPESDQMPSACKNWFTIGRWADFASADRGITWISLDAPLLQVGGLTANLLNSQTNPDVWREHVDHQELLYSWAMNNHWGTNYRAYQDGPTLFRYILRPHGASTRAEASRLATGLSQPLLVTPARRAQPHATPLLQIASPWISAISLKPAQDGRATIVRLFNSSSQREATSLSWAKTPKAIYLSDTSERPVGRLSSQLAVAPQGLVTLRVEFE